MKVDVILGLQWGDEGKGKIVDLLSNKYDVIARFQGGPNAGHTIIVKGQKFVLHQIPSGITREGVYNVIGNAVILDPVILLSEIKKLEAANISVRDRLMISKKANLILPTHKLLDAWQEKSKGKVGTTLKGIGPTYQDKTGRFGVRIGDIFQADFDTKYQQAKMKHLSILRAMGCEDAIDDTAFLTALEEVKTLHLADAEYYLNDQLTSGKKILAEGAQGSLLDIDFGTYPFVTSSNTVAAAACTGLGISPKKLGKIFGIFKAYCTRVGDGPFPTELLDEVGENLRQKGNEFGSTTGRPRRTGWLDIKALNYACMLSGVDELFIMKMDVMNDLPEVKICTDYHDNQTDESVSFSELTFNSDIKQAYMSMPGWSEEISSIKNYDQLPTSSKNYIEMIENLTATPISLVSVGPERDETIFRS